MRDEDGWRGRDTGRCVTCGAPACGLTEGRTVVRGVRDLAVEGKGEKDIFSPAVLPNTVKQLGYVGSIQFYVNKLI